MNMPESSLREVAGLFIVNPGFQMNDYCFRQNEHRVGIDYCKEKWNEIKL